MYSDHTLLCGFFFAYIPFLLEAAAVLATFVCLCLLGLTHLPPTCNSKLFGYNSIIHLKIK
ncbi:hypothetical protein B9J87_07075 [Vibrio sp. V19_P1S1T109]|nr:hypothetical protein B9J87_07075 [Vibrio sp. V19_P1S1T109]